MRATTTHVPATDTQPARVSVRLVDGDAAIRRTVPVDYTGPDAHRAAIATVLDVDVASLTATITRTTSRGYHWSVSV